MTDQRDITERASEFPNKYKLQMIRAYPTIARMDADEEFFATTTEREIAFDRILRAKNLRRTHEMFLVLGLADSDG